MIRSLLLSILASSLIAQNPETSAFPPTPATDTDLLVQSNRLNNSTTLLNGNLTSSATSMVLTGWVGFKTPLSVSIDNEIIICTTLTGVTLSGCLRGQDGSAAVAHNIFSTVSLFIIAKNHNKLAAEIKAIETYLAGLAPGSGTVTHTGNLILNCIVTGSGSTVHDVKCVEPTSTMDSSGNFSIKGSLTTDNGNTQSGEWCPKGITSGTACIGAQDTAGTPNPLRLPSATGTAGYILSTNGANPQLLSWIAPAGGASSSTLIDWQNQQGSPTSLGVSDTTIYTTTAPALGAGKCFKIVFAFSYGGCGGNAATFKVYYGSTAYTFINANTGLCGVQTFTSPCYICNDPGSQAAQQFTTPVGWNNANGGSAIVALASTYVQTGATDSTISQIIKLTGNAVAGSNTVTGLSWVVEQLK